jgi:hypothetical protein
MSSGGAVGHWTLARTEWAIMRQPMTRLTVSLLLVPLLSAIGASVGGSEALAVQGPASARGVLVSGTVATVCPGPPESWHQPRCLRTATFRRGTHRYTVRGHFSILLPRGRYHLSVDGCAQRGFYVVRHAMRGVHLAPRGCFYPA